MNAPKADPVFKFTCPYCSQSLEATVELIGVTLDCPVCSKSIVVPGPKTVRIPNSPVSSNQQSPTTPPQRQAISGEIITNVKQGAIIGGWACFVLGILCMLYSLFTIFLYGPFFLVAFILSIVAMSQRRVLPGILLLVATLIVPPVFGMILTASRTAKFADDLSKSAGSLEASKASISSKGKVLTSISEEQNASDPTPSLLEKLDEKNGFQDFKLGSPLTQFSGLTPLKEDGDTKPYNVDKINSKLGSFEISRITLYFEIGLLKEITVFAEGKQNIVGLKETLIQAYGPPSVERSMFDNGVMWRGKKVSLRYNVSVMDSESAHATFRSMEVEEKIKAATDKKAKEGAADAS